jgi:MFS family permease
MLPIGPLRRRDFRFLYAAQFVSFFGTMITFVAVPYQMYRLTESSLSVGLLGLAELAALLTTVFVGGALADSVDRRRMSIWTDVALAAGSAALMGIALAGITRPWMLYVLAAWMAGVAGLQRPSMDALVPRLVDKDQMPAAASLAMFRGSLGAIGGPAVAGVIIAAYGVDTAYLVDFISYAVSLFCLWQMGPVPPPERGEPPSLKGIVEGFKYAASRQELIGTYVVDFVAMIFGMPMALFPAMADQLGGPKVLGMLYAAPAIGALVVSLSGKLFEPVRRHGLGVLIAAGVWGLAIIAFGFSNALWLSVACLALAGGADAVSAMYRMTMWNQTIPDALRGRLASIEIVSYTSGPMLGHVEAGLAAAAIGLRGSVISGGVLCVLGVLFCAWKLPKFVSYRAS